MNEYFCSIGETLAAFLSKEIGINGRIFDFREINDGDINEVIFRFKIKKSFGNDNISGYF